ncbi:GNAT family N-acetyltransferase [Microbacterium sp. CPCC 204701]|uniref:GNAT family N-acetyltransferase n=1 Tax=Microbacterium sp. CPCC 204701 TaxID=2493084 RepID=UPI000FD76FA0|nr:GNAT family N-acetyltransferase [Microbacterium sp. CPCC 204701]
MSRTVRSGECRVTSTTLGELGPEEFARWRDLEGRAIATYPQICVDYLEPAQRLRPGASEMRLLIVSRDDRWLLLLPFSLGFATDRGGARAITTADETMDHESAKLYPLIDSAEGSGALAAALAKARALGLPGVLRVVLVDDLPDLERAILGGVGHRRSRCIDGAQVSRPVAASSGSHRPMPRAGEAFTPEYATSDTSSSTRRKLGRLARRLSERVGELSVIVRDGDPAMVEDFLALQTAGWKGDPTRGGEGYDVTGRIAWFRAFTRRYHDRGDLYGIEFRGGDRVLYSTLVLRQGRVIHGLQDAYDEEFAEWSVGTLGRRAVLNVIRELDIDTFDPNMSWYNFEAARVYPQRRGQREYVLAGPGVSARAVVMGIRAARAARVAKDRLRRGGTESAQPTGEGADEE